MIKERIRGGLDKLQGAEGLLFFGHNGKEKSYGTIETSDGQFIDGEPKEGPKGPYDRIIKFGCQNHTKGKIAPVKRYTRGRSPNLTITGSEDESIKEALKSVSHLVNNSEHSHSNAEDRLVYQETIMPVFEKNTMELYEELKKQGVLENNNYVICGPLRGGEFTIAALIYNAHKIGWDIPFDRIACYELKRVLMDNGELFIGARLGYWPDSGPGTVTVVADDCIASDRSGMVTVQIAEEQALGELANKKLGQMTEDERVMVIGRQKYRYPVMMVAAASQQGIMNLESKNAKVITGGAVYSLNDSLYLMRTSEEEGFTDEDFFVGDMGSWLGRLPEAYDDKAPWNKVRRELVNYWVSSNKLPKSLAKTNYCEWK
ncbi:MAG TPA: hypothetical protein VF185_01260 [Patescibacteria group bacterium]